MTTNILPHDNAFNDFAIAMSNARNWYEVAKTHPLAVRCTLHMEESIAAHLYDPATAFEKTVEMEYSIINKAKIFLN